MNKAYEPAEVEPRWLDAWASRELFKADPASRRPRFSVVLPPPNVTGELHLGHATNGTIQDALCRRKRMQGYEVLWLPGSDHAAIATQNVIERRLAGEGTSKEALGREEFENRVQAWYQSVSTTIVTQWRSLGASLDWSRLRFTMDPRYVRSVRVAFVEMHQRGLIYRGARIVNWCPRCLSAISDLEVDYQARRDTLFYVRYPLADGSGHLTIATVRPETMLADTAVAVNPGDARYSALVGQQVRLPLTDRTLQVIADQAVDPSFGTGVLKVTPGHDPTDYEIGVRHSLEVINSIHPDGTMNLPGFGDLDGLSCEQARARVVEALRSGGWLDHTEVYPHEVGTCDRCGAVIEPLISDQWWCSMSALAKPAIEAVEQGRIRFHPKRYGRDYLRWMRGLRDWCVSRQLWLGHRIPIYNCANGHQFASVDDPINCPQCGALAPVQDPDVLDTWFSSALWPFATMGWPDRTVDLAAFYPTDVLSTAREIIHLWVSRMIMTGIFFMGQPPFSDVVVHAVIQDRNGQRMSKSKGNVVDPTVVMRRYGADALRAWCAKVGMSSQDVRFDESKIEGYRRFANKLWNATRLVVGSGLRTSSPGEPELADRWIRSRLRTVIADVDRGFDRYSFHSVVDSLHDFIWHEYCDWYLELVKPRLRQSGPSRDAAVATSVEVLDASLRLLHPIMPFVTEELWQQLPRSQPCASLQLAPWPVVDELRLDAAAEAEMETVMQVVSAVRQARSDLGLGARVEGRLDLGTVDERLDPLRCAYIRNLAGVELGSVADHRLASAILGGEAHVQFGGVEAKGTSQGHESARLRGELVEARTQVGRLAARLANPDFIRRAPSQVVSESHLRLGQWQASIERLEARLAEISQGSPAQPDHGD